jgi:hypothetical protein
MDDYTPFGLPRRGFLASLLGGLLGVKAVAASARGSQAKRTLESMRRGQDTNDALLQAWKSEVALFRALEAEQDACLKAMGDFVRGKGNREGRDGV